MAEALYYIDDFSDEVLPCAPTLDGWAAWLAMPAAEDESPREPARIGEIFEASRLFVLGDIRVTRDSDGWVVDGQVPEGATAFYLRWHEGAQGWCAEHSGETPVDALKDIDLDDVEAFLACVADGGTRRLRFALDDEGRPALTDVTETLEVV